ncbi:hypothetical protein JCM10450v2_003014 [Rhodotorula kratochvilovae]
MPAQLEDEPAAGLAPPPSYASLASPLVPQTAFDQPEHHDDIPVHPAFDHAYGQSLNLPRGFFLIRNAAQGKALDLLQHRQNEGAELGLHPIKQPQLQGLSLQHTGNNQLFALSWDGHLFSASASREIDVEDNRLVLAFPHPITTYPSPLSHPPPRFRLDPSTSTLHVIYSHDPSFTGPDDSSDWRDDDYIVEAVPLKRKPAEPPLWSTTQANHILSAVGSRAANLGARVGGLLGGRFSQPSSPNPAGRRSSFEEPDLPPPPPPEKVVEKDVPPVPSTSELPDLPSAPSPPSSSAAATTGTEDDSRTPSEYDSDSDSEPSAFRPVRVVRLPPHWRDKFPSAALRAAPNTSFGVTRWPASAKELRKWRRRQWDVVPVTVQPLPAPGAHEGFLVPSPAGSESAPRSRSDSVSLFGSEGEQGAEVYDPAGEDDEDAPEIDSRDFSPLGIASPIGDIADADLPALPSGGHAALTGLGRRASAAASHLSGLLGGVTRGASNDGSSSSRSGSESPLPPAPANEARPLPPSPPLPSVPFAATAAAQAGDADGEAELRTPRPDNGAQSSAGGEWDAVRSGEVDRVDDGKEGDAREEAQRELLAPQLVEEDEVEAQVALPAAVDEEEEEEVPAPDASVEATHSAQPDSQEDNEVAADVQLVPDEGMLVTSDATGAPAQTAEEKGEEAAPSEKEVKDVEPEKAGE